MLPQSLAGEVYDTLRHVVTQSCEVCGGSGSHQAPCKINRRNDCFAEEPIYELLAPSPTLIYTPDMSQSRPSFLDLSVAERVQLAEDIWDSIPAENPESVALSALQLQELQARLDAHDQDPSSAISWDQVRSELFQRNCSSCWRLSSRSPA